MRSDKRSTARRGRRVRGRQALVAAVVLVAASAVALPAAAGAAQDEGAGPRHYHVIRSSLGNAALDLTDGCLRTEAFVSSAVAMYGAQPGPVTKQGGTDVFVRVSDVCAVAAAAAGGGGTVLAEYEARSAVPLVVDPRLRDASVGMAVAESSDPTTTVAVEVRWTGTGPLEHDTGSTHELYPGVGVTSSSTNDVRRAATAEVAVRVEGSAGVLVDVVGTDEAALLEQTRFRCIEVPRPGVPEFYPCFGFPG